MAEHDEIYKKIFLKLLEELIFILIALFIIMGIYIPIKNILNKVNKEQETIRFNIHKEETKNSISDIEDEVIIKKNQDEKYDIEIKNSYE